MGSKNLKAIAVRGKNKIAIANPERFKEAASEGIRRVKSTPRSKYGAIASSKTHVETGVLPGKHYQTTVFPNWVETRTLEAGIPNYLVKAPAAEHAGYACPRQCFNMIEVKTGKYAGLRIRKFCANPGRISTR